MPCDRTAGVLPDWARSPSCAFPRREGFALRLTADHRVLAVRDGTAATAGPPSGARLGHCKSATASCSYNHRACRFGRRAASRGLLLGFLARRRHADGEARHLAVGRRQRRRPAVSEVARHRRPVRSMRRRQRRRQRPAPSSRSRGLVARSRSAVCSGASSRRACVTLRSITAMTPAVPEEARGRDRGLRPSCRGFLRGLFDTDGSVRRLAGQGSQHPLAQSDLASVERCRANAGTPVAFQSRPSPQSAATPTQGSSPTARAATANLACRPTTNWSSRLDSVRAVLPR